MRFKILTSKLFDKEFKSLCKKHASAKTDVTSIVQLLQQDPFQGTNLGNNCYKIRIAIKSKGKGKSGGARLITNICIIENEIYLLSIYDKAEKESISDKDLNAVLKSLR